VRAAQTTFAPSRANNSAIVRPIPRLAPVMIATFPSNFPMGLPRCMLTPIYPAVGRRA
jgi:hypothetical protein